jgi:hypothetical protein
MSESPVRFAGPVRIAPGYGALRTTLSGRDATGRPLTVGFAAAAPAGLPAQLPDAVIEPDAGGALRIRSSAGVWAIAARSAHVHTDVGAAFYRAIPPRPVPLSRRLFWRAVLMLAGSRGGMALLRTLRGGG